MVQGTLRSLPENVRRQEAGRKAVEGTRGERDGKGGKGEWDDEGGSRGSTEMVRGSVKEWQERGTKPPDLCSAAGYALDSTYTKPKTKRRG